MIGQGLYFHHGKHGAMDERDYKPTVSGKDFQNAYDGNLTIDQAKEILQNKQNYLRLPFAGYLVILSHYPPLAKLVHQDKSLHCLLTVHQKAVIAMNKTIIKKNFSKKFKINPSGMDALRQTYQASLKDDTPDNDLVLTDLKDVLTDIEKEQEIEPLNPVSGKGFNVSSTSQIWVSMAKASPQAAEKVLNTPALFNDMSLSDLCEIASTNVEVANKLLSEPRFNKHLTSLQIIQIAYPHQPITDRLIKNKKLWNKLSADHKTDFGMMHESAAHKVLDDYGKKLTLETLGDLAESSLSVAQRIAITPKLMRGEGTELLQNLTNMLTFCERFSLKLKSGLEKQPRKLRAS